MSSLREEIDAIPVTIVVAIAYATLAVVTGMFGDRDEFHSRIVQWGLLRPDLVAAGEPWRLLAHALLHLNLVHIAFNTMSLWALGPALERSLGSVRFAVLYAVSALGGGLAVCAVYQPWQGVAGGSGALFGMLGAAVAMNMRSGRHALAFLEFEGPRRLLATIAVYIVLGALVPVFSNTGHIGGLLAGFAVTVLWLDPPARSAALRRWRLAVTGLFAGLLFWALVPVTRVDWLVRQSQLAEDPARALALQRAAWRSDTIGALAETDDTPGRERGR